jgi:hypothetical protein
VINGFPGIEQVFPAHRKSRQSNVGGGCVFHFCQPARSKTGSSPSAPQPAATLPTVPRAETRALVSILQQRAHGSVFDTITQDTLWGVEVVVPPHSIVEAFEQAVAPALECILNNLFECRTLAALRDTLLPKLLSSELRLKETEEFVDAANGDSIQSRRRMSCSLLLKAS